jgi:ATP-dependent Clp protease ATP-binding subunit ClpB
LIFNRLNKESIRQIFLNHIKKLNQVISDKKIVIKFGDDAINYYIDQAFKPEFGARPLKRIIERDIKNILANLILKGDLKNNQEIEFFVENNEISYRLSRLASVS